MIARHAPEVGAHPTRLKCPSCSKQVVSQIESETYSKTHFCAAALILTIVYVLKIYENRLKCHDCAKPRKDFIAIFIFIPAFVSWPIEIAAKNLKSVRISVANIDWNFHHPGPAPVPIGVLLLSAKKQISISPTVHLQTNAKRPISEIPKKSHVEDIGCQKAVVK